MRTKDSTARCHIFTVYCENSVEVLIKFRGIGFKNCSRWVTGVCKMQRLMKEGRGGGGGGGGGGKKEVGSA